MSDSLYSDPRLVRHIPLVYPKLKWREIGPFAASVMLVAAKHPLYTEAEKASDWFKKRGKPPVGADR